ncbi:hypothetical protein [Lysinibacillus piscis]|uniref:hypothetical protein n=1 Tax=Lysinibacillus piscis TaxID=2518931 RepID=UPI0022305DF9|nr:hypothetical protein [Lysinibacillus sp. KH24]
MKETSSTYCGECLRDFEPCEVVHYTWTENRCFCHICKSIMNTRSKPSWLDWQPRKVKG